MSDDPQEIAELPHSAEPARDGIDEEDHPIPLWFNAGFAVTIAFAFAYFPYWTWISDWTPSGEWSAQTAAAQERAEAARAALPQHNPYRGQVAAITEGQQLFASICSACHRPDGSGLIGPSLVDPYWKYASDDAGLLETVANGRPGGMPPWGPALGTEKIWKTLAYLETLPRSDRPGVGAPDYVAPAP